MANIFGRSKCHAKPCHAKPCHGKPCTCETSTITPCTRKLCTSHFVRSHILCSVRHQKVDSLPIDGIDLQKRKVVREHACLDHTNVQTCTDIQASKRIWYFNLCITCNSLPCQLQTTQAGHLHQCNHRRYVSLLKNTLNSETMLQIVH